MAAQGACHMSIFTPKQSQHHENFARPFETAELRQTSPLQYQACKLMSEASSRDVFAAGKKENGSEGLPNTCIGGKADKGAQETAASTNTDAIKGMNADGDKVKSLMNDHATPELFQELKENSEEEAINFALRNPEYQRQALHETDDAEFGKKMRIALTGIE
jgi:hypothetical protein